MKSRLQPRGGKPVTTVGVERAHPARPDGNLAPLRSAQRRRRHDLLEAWNAGPNVNGGTMSRQEPSLVGVTCDRRRIAVPDYFLGSARKII